LPTLANILTLSRLPLIPAQGFALVRGEYRVAIVLVLVSAFTDLADGIVARLFHQQTRFGAIADPVADKLTMLTIAILLAWQQRLPAWFAAAIVLRDAVIVAGALTYQLLVGRVEMAPTRLSKLNTALEFLFLVGVLAVAAGLIAPGRWYAALLWATTATILLSGTQYVVSWSRKALQATRSNRS